MKFFKGTNNRERLIGSRAYVRALATGNGYGLVTTRDLELADLNQSNPRTDQQPLPGNGVRRHTAIRLHPATGPLSNHQCVADYGIGGVADGLPAWTLNAGTRFMPIGFWSKEYYPAFPSPPRDVSFDLRINLLHSYATIHNTPNR